MGVLGEEKVQLQGYSCVKPKSSLGPPPCTLTALSCGEGGALPNGLWGGCSACLAARLPLCRLSAKYPLPSHDALAVH